MVPEGQACGTGAHDHDDRNSEGSSEGNAPESLAYRGGAGLGRSAPPAGFQAATQSHQERQPLTIRRVGTTNAYRVAELPESHISTRKARGSRPP